MNLYKTDLMDIGHTNFEQNGKLVILSDGDGPRFERILLREILALFDAKIVSVDDDYWEVIKGNSGVDTRYTTDLDWSSYLETAAIHSKREVDEISD